MCAAAYPQVEIGLGHGEFPEKAVRHLWREVLASVNEDGSYRRPAAHLLKHGSHFDEVGAGADDRADSKVFHAGNKRFIITSVRRQDGETLIARFLEIARGFRAFQLN